MGLELFLTFFLVLLNGFFVAAEFAIVKVRSSQLEVQGQRNKLISRTARSIVGNLDAYLAATQLGITLASLGLGWVGEEVFTRIMVNVVHVFNGSLTEEQAHPFAAPLAFAVITVLHIVFGELAPKTLAIRFPASTTFTVSLPLRLFYLVFRPFIWALNGFAAFILRLLGIRAVHGAEIHSEEELKMIISESHEGGAIEETERELIQNVFDFDDRRVWDILTPRKDVCTIPSGSTLKEAFDLAIQEGYSRFPVVGEDADDIKGIVNMKDIMRTMLEQGGESTVEGIIRETFFVSESKKINILLKDFQRRHTMMAIVTGEVGEVSGIVTLEDVLEELVGEIQDEYDNEVPDVQTTENGTFLVNAHQKLADLNKHLPHRFEEDEPYDTLSGLISYNHPDELKVGDVLKIDGYEARILKMFRNSVEQVELIELTGEEEEE
jgi:CBS domain containing-hemolysin-like protein